MTLMITEIPLPAPPFDLLRQEADRAKERARTTGFRGQGAIEKEFRKNASRIAKDFEKEIQQESSRLIATIAHDTRKERQVALRGGEPIEQVLAGIDLNLKKVGDCIATNETRASGANAERSRCLEQAESVTRQRVKASGSPILRFVYVALSAAVYYFLLKRRLRILSCRSVDHLARAESGHLAEILFSCRAAVARDVQDLVEELRRETQAWCEEAEQIQAGARSRRSEQESRQANRGLLPDFSGLAELAAQVTASSETLISGIVDDICNSDRSLAEAVDASVSRAVSRCSLPATLSEELDRIRPERRNAKLNVLHQDSAPPVIVKFLEAPLPERARIRLLAIPGGTASPFYGEIRAGGGEIDTVVLDSDENEIAELINEEALCAAQVPLLGELRSRTPREMVDNARFTRDNPHEFDLAAARLDSEDLAIRRLVLGQAIEIIESDRGSWYRTVDSKALDGFRGQRIAQGFKQAIDALRHSDLGAAVDIAIENVRASLGTDEVIALLESARINCPAAHTSQCREIIHQEVRAVRRELLTG